MKRLFVDTGAFVAKEIAADQFHQDALRGWAETEKHNYRLFSSEHVFDECATLFSGRTTYAWAAEWGADVLDAEIDWLRAEPEEWQKALVLMRKYSDQGVSFTDCLSAVLMKREGLKLVFGFDRHFEDMGFRLWPLA
jgi:uncharacterized protein